MVDAWSMAHFSSLCCDIGGPVVVVGVGAEEGTRKGRVPVGEA